MKKYDIAIVGATGLVGSTFLKVMAEYKIEVNNLYLYASKRSEGKVIEYLGKKYTKQELKDRIYCTTEYGSNLQKFAFKMGYTCFEIPKNVFYDYSIFYH